MGLRLIYRRLPLSASSSAILHGKPSTRLFWGGLYSTTQRRDKWSINVFKGWGKSSPGDIVDNAQDPVASELDDPKKRQQFLQRNMHGRVEHNIFEEEIEAPMVTGSTEAENPTGEKTKENLAMVVDPDPRSRIRWQRKKIIQMVRNNGMSRIEEGIRMYERKILHKSEFIPTSVKKLVMLARQISGKSVDEAIVQMAWSKKKMAAEIKYYLEEARDLAIAQHGMGLGKVNGELFDKPRKFRTKDGRWMEVIDPTRIYIAQSWVGRGAWRGKEIDYKGRGRMGVIQHPSTSFTVVLKEERTRIREHAEREAKLLWSGPWVHLPNRRIHGQRPYYSW